MEQTLIFSGLSRFPGGNFRKGSVHVFLSFGSPCSYYPLPVGSTISGYSGPGSAEHLFPLKPKNPI